jgi:hypothetical protein
MFGDDIMFFGRWAWMSDRWEAPSIDIKLIGSFMISHVVVGAMLFT